MASTTLVFAAGRFITQWTKKATLESSGNCVDEFSGKNHPPTAMPPAQHAALPAPAAPTASSAAPVYVTAGGRTSNEVTLASGRGVLTPGA